MVLIKDNIGESFTSFRKVNICLKKRKAETVSNEQFYGNCFTGLLEQNQGIQVLGFQVANFEQIICA